MEIREPIYVTDEMLKSWGACDQRRHATRLFPDGRIPFTPEACTLLLDKGMDVRSWLGGILTGRKARPQFHLTVEALVRGRLGREDGFHHLAVTADVRECLATVLRQHYTGAQTLAVPDARWLEHLRRMLDLFYGRPGSRSLVSHLCSCATRVGRREHDVLSLKQGTRTIFDCLCQAVYWPHPKQQRLRDKRGRFIAFPSETPTVPLPLRSAPQELPFPPEWATRVVQPSWGRANGYYLVTEDSGLTWTTATYGTLPANDQWTTNTATSTSSTSWSIYRMRSRAS